MTKKQRALEAVTRLKTAYPLAECSLEYKNPYHLLVSVRLAAQCTDARVNLVTPALFAKYPTPHDLAEADLADVQELIKSCGLFKTKARDLIAMAQKLTTDFHEVVPDTMEELLSLPGVGRKSANLILGDIFGKPAIVADTHCIRLSGRIGLTDGTKDPYKTELQLLKIIPPDESNNFCHRLVLHGRAVCDARKPNCSECILSDICKSCGKF